MGAGEQGCHALQCAARVLVWDAPTHLRPRILRMMMLTWRVQILNYIVNKSETGSFYISCYVICTIYCYASIFVIVLRGVGVMHYADLQSDYDVTTALVQIQLCEHYKKTATKLIHLIMGSYLELA